MMNALFLGRLFGLGGEGGMCQYGNSIERGSGRGYVSVWYWVGVCVSMVIVLGGGSGRAITF